MAVKQIEAYNVKTKKKEVMTTAVIDKNGARYFAKGTTANGDKVCAAMGAVAAEQAIKDKVATKGKGW